MTGLLNQIWSTHHRRQWLELSLEETMAKARTRRSLCERTSVSVSKMRSPPSASTTPARKMPKMTTMEAKMASFLFPTNMVVMAAMFCDGFAALSCVEAVGMTTSEEDFLISTRFACVCVHSTSKLIGALFHFGICGPFKTRKDLGSCDEVVACSTCSSRPGLRAYAMEGRILLLKLK